MVRPVVSVVLSAGISLSRSALLMARIDHAPIDRGAVVVGT
jgi:hypothetical protein